MARRDRSDCGTPGLLNSGTAGVQETPSPSKVTSTKVGNTKSPALPPGTSRSHFVEQAWVANCVQRAKGGRSPVTVSAAVARAPRRGPKNNRQSTVHLCACERAPEKDAHMCLRVCPHGEAKHRNGCVAKECSSSGLVKTDPVLTTTLSGRTRINDPGPDPPRRAAEGHRGLEIWIPNINVCSFGPYSSKSESATVCST